MTDPAEPKPKVQPGIAANRHAGRVSPRVVTRFVVAWFAALSVAAADEPNPFESVGAEYARTVWPMVKQFCLECHATDVQEGDLDLERFATLAEVRRATRVWQKVAEMLDNGEMPPKKAKQPSAEQRTQLRDWVERYLNAEARAQAGDPGPVVLRRLNNAEYTYTVRDLTGVDLEPAREFPADSAAGEGFTNTGNALVMSPALLTKYLDAGKDIARHAVLLPDGIRFSPATTRRDWTEEILAEIRDFYRQFTDPQGGSQVNLQGIVFDTNVGGRLPLEKYFAATLAERNAIDRGTKTIAAVARERGLSEKYLAGLWSVLNVARLSDSRLHGSESRATNEQSLLLDGLRARWRIAKPEDAPALAVEVARWQQALWRFTSVGHIGKVGGPKAWMEPVNPITARHELRLKLPAAPEGQDIVLYLAAGDAGDGNEQDFVVWERPRLVAPGRPDLLLRDVRPVTRELAARRERLFASAAKCLTAAADVSTAQDAADVKLFAQKHGVDADALAAWLDYLGIGTSGPVKIGSPITRQMTSASGYDFIKGWVGDDALSVVANSSDQHVRIPGNMAPHSVAVHPSPTLQVAVGWRSPAAATLRIEGQVQHAHPECGNGVIWSLELRRGNSRQRIATGTAQGANKVKVGPLDKIAVRSGDLVSLVIGPRDGNHACDLTAIDLTLDDGKQEWNLARDVSPDILAGNPHNDPHGNADVWHFYSEPANGSAAPVIPAGSLVARWQSAASAEEKQRLAEQVQRLLQRGVSALPKDSADAALYRQLTSLGGPLFASAVQALSSRPAREMSEAKESSIGLDPALFGKHPNGSPVEPASLCVRAPAVIEVRLPADLVAGAEFITVGTLHADTGKEGSVQLQVLTTRPETALGLQATAVTETDANGPWTSNNRRVSHSTPIVVTDGSAARRRIEGSFDEFRRWFPAALCYTKIVPVDEVVTLTLFYREDDHLSRLMLSDADAERLDRLWHEMHFVSHDALTLVDAFAQLMEYATQDADPKVFEPLRKPIHDRAAAFRKSLVEAEPTHVDALLDFATRAYRRPLTDDQAEELRGLYRKLRVQELPHDEAFRFTLARIFVSPAFLYRIENSSRHAPRAVALTNDDQAQADGTRSVPATLSFPVSDWELATRLSYFLWSSVPDSELRDAAATGRLREPDVLADHTRRMLLDDRVRRMATEFACQWLHIYDFDKLDEKSERHFPTFAGLRGDMYEESIRFFTDVFQRDASVLSILDADHTFLNEALAKHYGIPVEQASRLLSSPTQASGTLALRDVWQRVDGVKQYGRGGILALSTTLAKQSGASRTSPILRGNWVSEVLLGEKLPRPPKDVPPLPEDETATDGLTVRQLVEKHSSDPRCAKCHVRIDPLGHALEGFDAIGRRRDKDLGDRPIDTHAKLQDGAEFDGIDGLRDYLLTTRRDAFVRQFCRKLLGYSLGRSVQLSDEPLLAEMQTELKANDYRVAASVVTIVRSRQFREIRGRDAADED